ncbi:hypothetical protein BROUX41_004890 [Berkeleyomyces rouxiae]|uniref:uncharacterized protein n=1 Tax=Berkeleyomyces rouxiae TaxID=2035830 RepID=UPI003B778F3E
MSGDSSQLDTLNLAELVLSGLVSVADCIVYVIILLQQLVYQVGFWRSVQHAVQALPFLLFGLPLSFIRGPTKRSSVRRSRRHPDDILVAVYHDVFAQTASIPDVAAVRCMRWGIENLPLDVSRVFLSNNVAISYWLWQKWRSPTTRDLRVTVPVFYDVIQKFTGIWVKRETNTPPEIVLYYIHGGGFTQGSAAFYLPWLVAYLTKLEEAGYKSPAIFAIDYSLAPESQHPVQIRQVLQGYQHVVDIVGDESQICIAADSAGAFLAMSLMTAIGSRSYRTNELTSDFSQLSTSNSNFADRKKTVGSMLGFDFKAPGTVILISPWLSLISGKQNATASDYITPKILRKYAELYAPSISTSCKKIDSKSLGPSLTAAGVSSVRPKNGYIVWFGEEEVLADDILEWVTILRTRGSQVTTIKRSAGIHVWPAASFFIRANNSRLDDMELIVDEMQRCMVPKIKSSTHKKTKKGLWGLECPSLPAALPDRHAAPASHGHQKSSLLDRKRSASASNDGTCLHETPKDTPDDKTNKKDSDDRAHHNHHHHGRKRFSLRREKNKGAEEGESSGDTKRKDTNTEAEEKNARVR